MTEYTPEQMNPGRCIAYSPDGQFFTAKRHDWRLLSEEDYWREPTDDEQAQRRREWDAYTREVEYRATVSRAIGRTLAELPYPNPILSRVREGTKRRWYCTRCREFDTTVTDA